MEQANDERKARGGRREGAGRPKGSGAGIPTKVMRVPVALGEAVTDLEDVIETLRGYRRQYAGSTSPRADFLNKMMKELEELYPWL